ncbi:MAG: heparan-alpha-glucosaminide N-acetyltransferase domain-containing protein [Roseibacillus sp.]
MAVAVEAVRERLIFIDALRGYAILMMLQGHTVGVVLQEKFRDPDYPAYLVWHYLTGLTAPAFFLAAGLIFAYLMARAEEVGGSRLMKGVKRGGWLMVLGWVLQLWPPILVDMSKGDWGAFGRIVGKSHVLHTIGLSLIVMVGLWLLCGRRGKVFAVVAVVFAQLALLGGPVIERWQPASVMGRVVGTFVARDYAVFPIFPWVGYSLMGGALGVLAWKTKWYRRPRYFGVLMGVGVILMAGNQWITAGFWSVMGALSPEDLRQFAGRYWRAGEVLFFTGLVGLVCYGITRKKWEERLPVRILTTCGKETLTIYFLHVFVVYSVVFGVGLSVFFKREFGPWGAVGTALLVQGSFILLAMNLQKLRKAWPWLRLLR